MPEQSNDYRVVVCGSAGVGKTSLVLKFVKGSFRENYIPTIEDTYRQVIQSNKIICTLQIIDTSGSHHFPAMQNLNISKAHAFILVYSVTKKATLEALQPMYEKIKKIKDSEMDFIPIMLVGTKCDEEEREVSKEMGECEASKWNCAFIETSAKTNHNITEVFKELLQLEKRRSMTLNSEKINSRTHKPKTKESAFACDTLVIPSTKFL